MIFWRTIMKERWKNAFILAVLGFVIAAFAGWVYEELCVRIKYGAFSPRGMLDLPLLPIYGFGAWSLAVLLRRIRSVWLFFALSVVISSVFEYACSFLLELIFHKSFWTYSDWPLAVHDRISLISSIIFGLLAVMFIKVVLPFVRLIMRKTPQRFLLFLSGAFVFVIFSDFIKVICQNE